MCEHCRQQHQHNDDAVRWLALLIRQAFLMVVKGIERRYGIGEHKEKDHHAV